MKIKKLLAGVLSICILATTVPAVLAADTDDQTENTAASESAFTAGSAIAAIDAIGEVTYKSKAAIQNARAAYEELTAEEQKKVANYEALISAETSFKEIINTYAASFDGITAWTFTAKELEATKGANANTLAPWMGIDKLTETEIQDTVEAAKDEIVWQYENGNNIGANKSEPFQNASGHLVMQTDDKPNDNVWNPWSSTQPTRYWAYLAVPFTGIAFSCSGYISAKTDRTMPLGDSFVYDGVRYQVFWYMQKWHTETEKVQGSMNGVTVNSNSFFPGSINKSDVTNNTFRYAYALYSQENKKQELTLGFTETDAVDSEGYVYQSFKGPQGNAYLVNTDERIAAADTSSDGQNTVISNKAYIINGKLAAAFEKLGDSVDDSFAVTGMPLADAKDGVQEFENGTLTSEGLMSDTEALDITLNISNSVVTVNKETGKYNITWNANITVGESLESVNDKAEFKSYGVIYGTSDEAVSALKVGENSSNAKTMYFGKSDEANTDITVYTIFGFRLKNVSEGRIRAARFFIEYEYKGQKFTVFSNTEETTVLPADE